MDSNSKEPGHEVPRGPDPNRRQDPTGPQPPPWSAPVKLGSAQETSKARTVRAASARKVCGGVPLPPFNLDAGLEIRGACWGFGGVLAGVPKRGMPHSPPSSPRVSALAAGPDPSLSPTVSTRHRSSVSLVPFPALADGPSPVVGSSSSTSPDSIEMEPVVGHRRRKSSLIHPVGGHRARLSITIPHDAPDDQAQRSVDVVKPDPASDSDSSADDSHPDEEMGLSTKDRSRRRRSRRRNRRLDNRIAREKDVTDAELREADHDVLRRLVVNGIFGLLWFTFSLCISLYNKWMFDRERLNFAFPLFTTSMHMLVQFALAGLVLYFVPSLRPQQSHNSDGGRSRHETEPNSSVMSKMFYLTRIGPCGAATGLDIGLGNASLKFISLTFYTMCKSSSLAFVLLFAFLFRLETPTWRLVAIITIMIMGVILMVFGEVEFKLGGFVLVISAAFFSGFRWGLTQILLLRNPATSNPFSSIFFLSPVMFVTLLLLAIPVEGFGPLWEGLKTLSAEWGVVMTPLFLLFPGCIAFLMTASEFALLQRTSVVTLSIAGIFKEVLTISTASLVFHDRLTPINIVGLLTTMAAIVAYNYIKITKMRQDAQVDVHGRHAEPGPLSPSSPAGSASEELDADDEAEETAGLLHQTQEAESAPALVTSDGDIQPNLLSPPHYAPPTEADDRRQGRVA
ncbi:hypothetical protein CDD80_5601 [Ophiocordyceps camponoti-rufipedis]|uniref:Sugar phosphate transporter domain-containing protein n=1 Tax=Ophiocordyceps camponoti-rufipedis TaxID=2004952 RepID=A0A2C5YU09_9HYPO|nr:hypothetical protein CDD80_5601 [Ophiocordyceps camponoti-rufipedis]